MRAATTAALVAFGFASVMGQVLLARELAAVFYGNELCLGFILGAWLLWGALGSLLGARISKHWRQSTDSVVFVTLQVLMIVLLLIALLAARSTSDILSWAEHALASLSPSSSVPGLQSGAALLAPTPGELLGPIPMFVITFIVTAPVALCMGFQFTVACRLYAAAVGGEVSGVAGAYVLDALGDMSGGAIVALLLTWHVGAMTMCGLVGLVAIAAAVWLTVATNKRVTACMLTGIGTAWLLLLAFGVFNRIETASERHRWVIGRLLETRDTVYGKLAVVQQSQPTLSFFENGLLMFSTENRRAAEELVHFPMLVHPSPKHVLLIGGGVAGALHEVLKYDVDHVTYVELDPGVIEIAEKYIPEPDRQALRDPRVTIELVDGRAFVKRTSEQFDVLIVALPDPFTAQLNRFYTLEFFRECARIMSKDGVISVGVKSSDTYLGPQLAAYDASIYETLRMVFPQIMVVPGDHMFLLGSRTGRGFTYDPQVLLERIKQRRHGNESLGEYYLPMRLLPGRPQFVLQRLHAVQRVRINRDFSPISYYYYMALSTTWFHPSAWRVFAWGWHLRLWHIVVGGIVLLAIGLGLSRTRRWRNAPTVVTVVVLGLSGITLEIGILFAFQVLYGYVYYKIGIIIAAFMLGMAIGSYTQGRRVERAGASLRQLTIIVAATAVTAAALPALFNVLARIASPFAAMMSAELGFPILTAVIGLLVGTAFPIATGLHISSGATVGEAGGTMYAADLVGACLGALLASVLLVPVLGIAGVCYAVAILAGAVLTLLAAVWTLKC